MNYQQQRNNSPQTKPPKTVGEPEIVSKDDSSNRLGARDKTGDVFSTFNKKEKALARRVNKFINRIGKLKE